MHISVPASSAVEIINVTQISPLISQCQVKVCYISDEPNRNGTIINKETAYKMAETLRGCPIVGRFIEETSDFNGHDRELKIEEDGVYLVDITKPYGFVDLSAKIWFQKFIDDDEVEREYLLTEGYIWTDIYEEAKRIVDKGNNQSMELCNITGYWKDLQSFVIDDAVIEKLCILGENVEPCFEGAQVKAHFSLKEEFEEFKNTMFSMIKELKEELSKGGNSVFTTYAVEIGDALWSLLYDYLVLTYPMKDDCYCSIYRLEGVYEEEGQKFAILQKREDNSFWKMNFTYTDEGFKPETELVEVTQTYVPLETPQFDGEAVEQYAADYVASHTELKEPEEPEVPTYNLEEIPEYVQLVEQFNELTNQHNELVTSAAEAAETAAQALADAESRYADLQTELEGLKAYKAQIETAEKMELINSFSMLSEEDKAEVIENVANYSLDEIESKLAVICVRKKVSFSKEETPAVSYNLPTGGSAIPAWVQAVKDTQNKI